MKKIVFTIPTLQGGGAEKVISNIILNLDKKKYDVSIIVFDLSKQIYLKKKNIKITNLKTKKISLGIIPFIKLINKLKPNVVISTVSHLNLLVSILKIFFPKNTKIIARESNFLSQNISLQSRPILTRILYKIFYNNIDISLVFSNDHKLDVLKNTNLNEKKIRILNNPVDFNVIKISSENKLLNKYKKFFTNKKITKFIFVGSLSHQKGIDILIKSLSYFNKSKYILNIIGQGSKKRELIELVRQKRLKKNINFIPYQINPFPFIKNSDVYCMFSRFEGMSNIALEALALNKSIFFLNNPGASTEILKKVSSAYLIKTNDPLKISKKMLTFKIKKNVSNKKILKNFDIKLITKKYEKIIDDII